VEGVPVTPESASLRGLYAITIRHHGRGPEADRIARDLRAARAAEYVLEWLAADPPPSVEQRAHVVQLLVLGGGA
jgi:hypothetical protein